MKSLLPSVVTLLAFSASLAIAAAPVPPPMDAAKMAQEMAQVPATDPATAGAPTIVDALKGVHPRLLFTAAEAQALKASIGSDPIMQKAYDGNKQWSKISLIASGPRPPMVTSDEPALVKSFSQAPSMAYDYAMDKDSGTKDRIIAMLNGMAAVDHWADANAEPDASMGAACNMFMVALLYDSVANDLDADTRAKLSQKIFTMARRMYYLGHKSLTLPFPGKGFWQADPQPNHRWYRDMGLAACVLAVADEKDIDASYLMQGLKDEMDIIAKWYPPDGDCHEGAGYQSFGYTSVATAFKMMDRCVGTTYLKDTGVRNAWAQQIYWWVPGRMSDISWGDDQNGPGKPGSYSHNDGSFFMGPALSKDPLAQAAMLMKLNHAMSDPAKPVLLPWTVLAFYDPTVVPGDYKTLPTYKLLPDIGAASMRDSWEDDAVVFTFKCGPYGGYKLNEYRNTTTDNGNPHYVNIAHDDPDANEFDLAVGGGFAFHPGNYTSPDKSKKLSGEHSTLTVDGKGQVGEGGGFSQPIGNEDMTKFSYLTGWKTDEQGHVIVEGEAGPSYCGQTYAELRAAGNKQAPAVLKTYRRTVIWMPKEYILILDNIATAGGSKSIVWHGSSTQAQVADGAGTVTTEKGDVVKIQTVSNQTFTTAVQPVTLVGRWGDDPINQIQYTVNAEAVKFATVLDPWKTSPEVKIADANGVATVTVHTGSSDDTWTWNEAKDLTTPSVITGTRGGKPLLGLTEADKAPTK